MNYLFRICLTVSIVLFLTSCTDINLPSKARMFEWMNESSDGYTLKEVQMDPQSFMQNRIMVSGTLAEIGRFNTYLVLIEDRTRLFVETINIQKQRQFDGLKVGQKIAVNGVVKKRDNYLVLVSDNIELIR